MKILYLLSGIVVATPVLTEGASTQSELEKIYNVPTSGFSQFDGSKQVRVSRIACSDGIMFELYQDTSKSKSKTVLMRAGSQTIANIDDGEALSIRLDGSVFSFSSPDVTTEHETIPVGRGVTISFSSKVFLVPEDFVRKVASAGEVLARIRLLNSSYIEGKCSPATLSEAQAQSKQFGIRIDQKQLDDANKVAGIVGFRRFVLLLDSTQW